MNRYVDVDKVIRDINEVILEKECDGKTNGFATFCFKLFANVLSKVPTADVEEVRHGKWIVCGTFDDFLKCSECGAKYPAETAIEFKGCPICRAKMDKEQEEWKV